MGAAQTRFKIMQRQDDVLDWKAPDDSHVKRRLAWRENSANTPENASGVLKNVQKKADETERTLSSRAKDAPESWRSDPILIPANIACRQTYGTGSTAYPPDAVQSQPQCLLF